LLFGQFCPTIFTSFNVCAVQNPLPLIFRVRAFPQMLGAAAMLIAARMQRLQSVPYCPTENSFQH
jgi:hypothetical protein